MDSTNNPLLALIALKLAKVASLSIVHKGGKLVGNGSVLAGSGLAGFGSFALCAFVSLGVAHSGKGLKEPFDRTKQIFHNNHPFFGKQPPYDFRGNSISPSNTMSATR